MKLTELLYVAFSNFECAGEMNHMANRYTELMASGHSPDPKALHSMWVDHMEAGGWEVSSGKVLCLSTMTHPLMVPYEKLPRWAQLRCRIFAALLALPQKDRQCLVKEFEEDATSEDHARFDDGLTSEQRLQNLAKEHADILKRVAELEAKLDSATANSLKETRDMKSKLSS